MSHFFAYLSKMKYIARWGLMRNTDPENLLEHSMQVALIAHALAMIRNKRFGGTVDAERVAVLALFHDAGEAIIGDLPTPIKYFNPKIRTAVAEIEDEARARLVEMLPAELREEYAELLSPPEEEEELMRIVKAADKISAYLKCIEESLNGNKEFAKAEKALEKIVSSLGTPEVRYFLETFVPSFSLTIDELN
jgi:5'-deoxynucleotidase